MVVLVVALVVRALVVAILVAVVFVGGNSSRLSEAHCQSAVSCKRPILGWQLEAVSRRRLEIGGQYELAAKVISCQ